MPVLIHQREYTAAELLPHAAPMLLLDDVVDYGDTHCTSRVFIEPHVLFYREGRGVPAYTGIEYMAQTIALWSGIVRRQQGLAPSVGFLLGTRKYETRNTFFPAGSVLMVRAEQQYLLDGMSVFACEISVDGELLASANINAYQPQDTGSA